ncbi:MAG TPA: rRNA pseudouridine synthase [Anaerolineae bacterium]|nr:rRNA pseudouridine synthase [Anaerolineae bacterium]
MARYILFHKPYGVLTQFTDPEGRPTLGDYIDLPGVYAAGRLDKDSEGLLLLTDDGQVLHRVTHPRWKLPKTYLVQVEGVPDEAALQKLREGVMVKGKRTAPAAVERLPSPPDLPPRKVRQYHPTPWLRITLREGRKRQVRRMTAAVGHPTLRLVRVAIGPLQLGDLPPGAWRELTEAERKALFRALGLPPDRRSPVKKAGLRRPRRQGRRKPRK